MPTTPAAWNSQTIVNTHIAGTKKDTQTIQLANGDYWIVWNDGGDPVNDQMDYDVIGRRFNALGEPLGGEVKLNSAYTAGDELVSGVATITGTTDFLIAYQTGSGLGAQIRVEHKSADGGHVYGATLAIAAQGTSVSAADIAVASATNGLLVFERTNGAGDTDIRAIRFDPTTMNEIGVEIDLSGQTDDSTSAQVSVLANGSYAVVFRDEYLGSTTDTDIKGSIVKQDGTATTFIIAGSTAYQAEPAIASLSNGNFVVTWTETADGDVKGAVVNSAGVVQGAHFTIASGANDQGGSQVVGLPDGGFAVAWQDGTSGLINMRSFSASGLGLGNTMMIADSVSISELSLTAMADGRVLLAFDYSGVKSQIWDPRSEVNAQAVYSPDGMQIGTVGDDVFETNGYAEIVHGWDGDDVITDGGGNQAMIAGDAGNDIIKLYGHDPLEHADGGTGTDTLSYLSLAAAIDVDLEAGTAFANDELQNVTNFEHFDANGDITAAMEVTGTDAVNSIHTGAGDDTLDGGAGADFLGGREGDDEYLVDDAGDTVFEYAGEGTDTVEASVDYTLGGGVHAEILRAGYGTNAIDLTGNEFSQSVQGNDGKNVLDGAGGNDTLSGYAGDDVLKGGAGNDSLRGGSGLNTVIGGIGNDTYIVEDVRDVIEELNGEGFDTVSVSQSYTLSQSQFLEVLRVTDSSSTEALKLVGNALINEIYGNAGNNILNGGSGADYLEGREGNDRYVVDHFNDSVLEKAGEGIDRVETSMSWTLHDNVENLILTGNSVINGTGNGLDNAIVGNSQGNVLNGGMGADLMEGKDGNDRYVIDNVGDKILETATGGTADVADAWISYSIAGQYVETLRLMGSDDINGTGNNQVNTILGNDGDNVIKAAGGDDKLYGGDGNDTMTGGTGGDRFIFDTALGMSNIDKILDFSSADDALYLDRDVFTAVNNGALNAGAFVIGSSAKDSNDRIVYDKANGDLYYDADGSGMGAAVHFASVADNTVLTSADFIGF